MPLRQVAAVAAIVAVAIVVGFMGGMAMIGFLNAVLPPFREDVDDDTMREFLPVAASYLTWAVTTVAVLLLAWRWSGREAQQENSAPPESLGGSGPHARSAGLVRGLKMHEVRSIRP